MTFDFQTNEASTFACRLDAGAFTACSSPQTYSGLANGLLHTFELRATDVAGNTSSASRSWTVDTVAPAITITTPANGAVYLLGAAVAASYACTDALSGIASCVGTVPNGSSFNTSSVGLKTFTVNAADQAGNTASLPVTYTITAPDLVEVSVTNPPVSAPTGTSFSVTDKAQNLGTASSGTSTTRYYLSLTPQQTNSGAILLSGSRSIPALTTAGASNSSQGATKVTIPAGTPLGTYYLLACADDNVPQEVIESNEVNNCFASAGTVQLALPDLTEASLTNPPSAATPGTVFSVTDRVQNSAVPAGASTTQYYISTAQGKNGSEILLGSRAVPALTATGPSSRSQVTVNLTIPAATPLGTYYLFACADDVGNAVIESYETNNCLVATNTVQVTLPDLVETSITNPPGAAARGSNFSVTDRVDNQGAVSSASSTTRYYLSTTQQKNGTAVLLTGGRSIPALSTNGPSSRSQGTATVTIPTGTAVGNYYLLACADDLNSNSETIETNNCLASSATVNVN